MGADTWRKFLKTTCISDSVIFIATMSWKEFFNSADLPAGSFRSIAGKCQ